MVKIIVLTLLSDLDDCCDLLCCKLFLLLLVLKVIPVFKKGDKLLVSNYRIDVSFLPLGGTPEKGIVIMRASGGV